MGLIKILTDVQTGADYYTAIRENGVNAVKNNLEKWLGKTSENGSGDDITVLFTVL